jgi:hypothetical protein
MKGCALAATKKKGKLSKSKLNSKLNKKRGGGGEPKVKPDIVLDAILLRRPRSAGPFPRASSCFPTKKATRKFQNRKGSRAADEDTKDKGIK